MSLNPYTTNDEVRAVLGTNIDELSNETLELGVYKSALELDLEGLGSGALNTIDAVLEKDDNELTDKDKKLIRAVNLFSTYSVARHLAKS